jgi:SAM-dependent methyltransferase
MDESQFLQRQSDFWNSISQTWSLQNKNPVVGWYDFHNNFPHYKNVLFRDIHDTQEKVVLEIGCGPGRNMILFRDKFARIDGVDIAPDTLEKARINLADAGVPIPNLWAMDGKSLPMIGDESYNIVFMVISHQHITSRSVRLNLYAEANRVLKPGGYFCFQTGYGPGHPRSVDYFAESFANEEEFVNKDVRVEDVKALVQDVEAAGFSHTNVTFTEPCKDEHPQWLWLKTEKR